MKRYFSLIVLLGLVMMMSGCVKMATKEFRPFVKTYHIRIGEVEVFKNPEVHTSGIKDIGEPADNSSSRYQDLIKDYKAILKTQLEKNGFVVVDDPDYQDLVIKTKIGDNKVNWLSWFVPIAGEFVCQVEIYQKGELVLFTEEYKNTGSWASPSVRLKMQIVPEIVAKLKKRFT